MADPKLDGNPAAAEPQKFLPLILHGDGGAFQKSDSIIVLSMRSLLSASSVAHSQMLLVAIPKSAVNKSPKPEEDTMACLWAILVWSLSYMFYGKHPEQDHQARDWHPKSARAQKAGSLLNSHALCGMVLQSVLMVNSSKMNSGCQAVLMLAAAGAVLPTKVIAHTMTTGLELSGGKP